MTRRARIVAYASAAVLVITGTLCAVLIGGVAAQVAAILLVTVGLGEALLLVFLEVGLSEDRARDAERPPRPAARRSVRPTTRSSRWPRRPT